MKKNYFVSLMLCLCVCIGAFAIKSDKISSPSTLKRELTMEKTGPYKDKIKVIKKSFPNVKDVAIESWSDGNKYYIIYSNYDWYTIMPLDSDKPYFYNGGIQYKSHLEIVERNGHKYLKEDDKCWYFISNQCDFNPQTDFIKLGNNEYVVNHFYKSYYIYYLDGKRIMLSENYEFREAETAGFTYDKSADMAIYHPAMPNRFFGYNSTPESAKYGHDKLYYLDYFENNLSKAMACVPGGDYYISEGFLKPTVVRNESRSDSNGKIFSFRVYEVESQYNHQNHMKLLFHGLDGIKSILPENCFKLKISTPDQIAYYTISDSVNRIPRMGCVSLMDYNFRVPALFNDVKVFYNSDGNPYAMVRMSAISPYTIYNPANEYKISDLSEIELNFEKGFWRKVVDLTKTKSIEELDETRFYAWLYAETESLKENIQSRNDYLTRLLTFSLYEHEESNLSSKWFDPWQFKDKFSLEDAIEWYSKAANSKNHKTYALMGTYLSQLKTQKEDVDRKVSKAEENYKKEKANAQLKAQMERNRMILEAEQARSTYAAEQQSNVLCILGILGNILDGRSAQPAVVPNTSNNTFNYPTPKYRPGELLEKTSISPEAVGMAISGGWVPDYSSETPSATSTNNSTKHSSSVAKLCHACYGSGKCHLCSGKGRYMPNLDGKYVDCDLCHKNGICHRCNGQGHL